MLRGINEETKTLQGIFATASAGSNIMHDSPLQIRIADETRRYQGWYERTVRMTGEKVVLDCNVQRPLPTSHEMSSGKVMGICRARE